MDENNVLIIYPQNRIHRKRKRKKTSMDKKDYAYHLSTQGKD